MMIDEFIEFENSVRVAKPGIFRLAKPDQPASDKEIEDVEALLGCRLPMSYRQFLNKFGGGDYPLMNVFSAYPNSEWYLVRRVEALRELCPTNLLPVHDDQAGGLLVLKIVDGQALEPVYYFDWETGKLSDIVYANVFSAVAAGLAAK
jgi:hypothetical protein